MNKELIENVTILTEENNITGNLEKAFAIKHFLENKANKELLKTNNLIVLYGPWGSGKSSLMKTIEHNVDKNQFQSLWFDTWKYEKDDNLAYSLFNFILEKTENRGFIESTKLVIKDIYKMFRCLMKPFTLNLGIINIDPSKAFEQAEMFEQENTTCLWQIMENFEKEFRKLEFKGKRLIVFLDDLDRCESENVINLISTIKLLLSINENIIFIFGVDKKAVTLALQNKYHNDYNKADEYLEKIFPIQFHITGRFDEEKIECLIEEVIKLPEEDINKIGCFFKSMGITNPRQVKKILRKYYTIKQELKRNGTPIKKVYYVIIVLYILMLYLTDIEEYEALLENNKMKCYDEVLLSDKNKNMPSFPITNVICQHREKNIMPLLMQLSSIKIIQKEKIGEVTSSQLLISYQEWQSLFPDNLCKRFVEYIYFNGEMQESLFKNGDYNPMYIYDIVRKLNNII